MQKTFGEFLKEKRQEKNLTQKNLANMLFVSESAVSKWEKNVAHPDIMLLPKLSEILGVTEHELITASIDEKNRNEQKDAKRWRALSFTWDLFFYIAYVLALIPCFICNLAINKTLSWFFIVFFALVLSFTFTNLPRLIKKNKLIVLPLSSLIALLILLAECNVYSNGNWFFIAGFSVLVGFSCVFLPIYIKKCKIFSKIKRYNDFATILIIFILINVLLVIINNYTLKNGYVKNGWYIKIGLPITAFVYGVINILLSVRFLRLNKLLKTSIVLFMVNFFIYIVPLFIKTQNISFKKELNELNIFKANFLSWQVDGCLEQNVHCIIFIAISLLAFIFFSIGLRRKLKSKN